MNVCGVLVHANEKKLDGIIAAMRNFDGLEVHQTAPGGRVVITVEDTKTTRALDTLTAVHKLSGVIAASLVYHSFEPASDAA